MSRPALLHASAALAIAAVAAALYLPFLDNPRVFDDLIFFSGRQFAYYATHPLGLDLRLPPYFTLTLIETLLPGVMEAQRAFGLVLHAAVGLALYRFLLELQRAALPRADDADTVLRAAIGAAAFVLHPVAVYGAGYLVQRSIVMATLFSLLSAFLFLRGLRRTSHSDALSAALLYWLTVLSKEHAVLLPAAVVPLVFLAGSARPFALRHAGIYLAACAPAAIFVTLLSLRVIGGTYEEAAEAIAAQVASTSAAESAPPSLLLSAATQAGLFFKYAALWLWPNPAGMSIDLRVDFATGASVGWIGAKLAAYVVCGALAVSALLRRGAAGIAGFGLLYAWVLFAVMFSAVLFQEPFVLYRSYLWGAGFACMAVAGLSYLPRRGAVAAAVLACTAAALLAHERLVTFSSSLKLWEDAVAKLPEDPVPWGSRALYQLGREYLYANRTGEAIAIAERCAEHYPAVVHCAYALGAIHLHLAQYELARDHLLRAISLKPEEGILHHRLGLAYEGLGRTEEARAAYRRSMSLGYGGARLELDRMDRSKRGRK